MSTFCVNLVTKTENNLMYCSFCKNIGIPGPHGHTIRDLKNVEKTIICPRLLANECTYCHKFGHTKSHCELLTNKANDNNNNKKRKLKQ